MGPNRASAEGASSCPRGESATAAWPAHRLRPSRTNSPTVDGELYKCFVCSKLELRGPRNGLKSGPSKLLK
eukprot:590511-Alexandrium_andersonii.AAC.1